MTASERRAWKPGKRDLLFITIVAVVVIALVLGTSERTTTPLPDDQVHRTTTSRAACMKCHGADGERPQPMGHTQVDKCLLCHTPPAGWKGEVK